MASRIQTIDWLNDELDSKESQLAAARQELDAARLSNRDSKRLLNELNHELAESRERENRLRDYCRDLDALLYSLKGLGPIDLRKAYASAVRKREAVFSPLKGDAEK